MIIIRVKEVSTKDRSLPKAFIPFFFISYFVFGIDFGFVAHLDPKYHLLSKRISTVISLTMIAILMAPLSHMYNVIWPWFPFWEYVIYFVILKMIRYSPCDFILDLCSPDDRVTKLSLILAVYVSLMMILKIFLGFIRCFDSKFEATEHCRRLGLGFYFIYHWPSLSVDVISVTLIIIYYYTCLKLKYLRIEFENSNIRPKDFLQEYIMIADQYDDIKPFLNSVVMASLVIGVPKLMITLWYTLLHFKQEELTWPSYTFDVIFTLHNTLQVCLPAFVAETINTETEAVQLALSKDIATGTNEIQIAQLNKVLQYLDRRHLRHEIFRIVPLDLRLPIVLFSLCSTYFIVILQFTHLYD